MDMNSQFVDWNEIEILVKIVCKQIKENSRKFSSIATVSRGGLVPARLLADCLGIKKIYVDKEKISSDSLFVDDIYDSGKTFEKIKDRTDNPSKLVYVTLFARVGKSYPKQLLYAQKTKNNGYVVFPWDVNEFNLSQN